MLAKLKSLFSLRSINCQGYSLLELLLASAVGSIVIAGSYTSFVIVAKQYQRIAAFSESQDAGISTIRLLKRDLRMAGRVALNASLDPVYGTIATPIAIVDSGNACCDSITIIYDRTSATETQRCQVLYDTSSRTVNSITRNALYTTVTTLSTSNAAFTCAGAGARDIVADYVDDIQFVGSDNDSNANPRIVDVSMILHGKTQLARTVTYTKPSQIVGNYNFTATDLYHRDEFTATVNIKNLR